MPKFLEVSNKAAAKVAINAGYINAVDYMADPADPATHSAGIQAAINAAVASGVGHVVIPGGEWRVDNITFPIRAPLRITGSSRTSIPGLQSESLKMVSKPTILLRTGAEPMFKLHGPQPTNYNNNVDRDNAVWSSMVRDVKFEHLSLRDNNPTATTPMVSMKHTQHCSFTDVSFYGFSGSSQTNAPLLDMIGCWDNKFFSCLFAGGGNAAGIPQIWIHAGTGPQGHAHCQELMFVNNECTNYFGPAIVIGDDTWDPANGVPSILQFVNWKLESQQLGKPGVWAGPHVEVKVGGFLYFNHFYIAHQKSAGPILDFKKTTGVYGHVGFNFIGGNTDVFSEMVRFDSNAYIIDLDIYPNSRTRETDNIVTIPALQAANPATSIRIHGPSRRINGEFAETRRIESALVTQSATAENTQMAYMFAKAGRSLFSIGNVSNPSGDQEVFSIRAINPANTGQALELAQFRVYQYQTPGVLNPLTARTDLVLTGFLNLVSTSLGWVNFPTLTADPSTGVGGMQLYVKNNGGGGSRNELHVFGDSAGRLVEARGFASTSSSSSLTINSNAVQYQTISALEANLTINAPTGTPTPGQRLTVAIRDNGTPRSLTWNAAFVPVKLTLPTTTVSSEWLVVRAEWNASAAAWLVVEVQGGAATIPQVSVANLTTDLAARELAANKGAVNGYASLDGGGKIPVGQLPSSVMTYLGVWNASTNTPTLANGAGDTGDVYRVSVAGTRDLGAGSVSYEIGDLVIYDGSVWQRSDSTDAVTQVNGYTGTVTLSKSDVGLGNADNTADSVKNVAAAAKLTTARTIGGVSFDGTASISLPGVDTSGTQNTTGSAATLTTGRTFRTDLASTSTATFNGSANVTPGVTGTLPVGNGGTGATTLTGLVKGSGSSAFTAATAGTDYLTTDDWLIDLDSGENTYPRHYLLNANAVGLNSQQVRFSYFTARRTETVNNVRLSVAIAGTSITLSRVGIYEVAGNGDLTLVAATANDTALLTSVGVVTKALSAGFTKTRGKRYAVAVLAVHTGTIPNLHGMFTVASEAGRAPRLNGIRSSQSDFGAINSTVAAADVTDGSSTFYAALVP